MESNNNLRGIVAMLVAVGFFSLMDGGLKHLSGHYPAMQVAAIRGLSSLPLVLLWVAASGTVGTLWKVRWPLHLLRGALSILMLSAFAYALKRMPMTGAYALFFVAPLLITALSVPLLGEKVGPRRWAAIAVGLLGVLVVLRPSGEGVLSWAGLAVLLAATGGSPPHPATRARHSSGSKRVGAGDMGGFRRRGAKAYPSHRDGNLRGARPRCARARAAAGTARWQR